jgi:aldose sugar dehydrogenase
MSSHFPAPRSRPVAAEHPGSSLRWIAAGTGVLLSLLAAGTLLAQEPVFHAEDHAYQVVTVAEGLQNPWGLQFLPGGDLLLTERAGRVRLVRNGVLQPDPVADLPEIGVGGQGGLLDLLLHPKFEENRLVYLSYSKPRADGQRTTAVLRGRWDGNRIADVTEIFVANAWSDRGQHFAGRMVIDANDYLFLSVGDRGYMDEAQNPMNHNGTVLRLHDDGRVPTDNPFVGQSGRLPEIWSWGNRNPQGMALHPVTGELWANEHGPRGGDEINVIEPGRNYGWPVISYGINYDGSVLTEETHREGMEQPIHFWVPSIATSGHAFYTGDAFPSWKGSVLVGGMAGTQIARLIFDGHRLVKEETLLSEYGERIRDVRNGPDGFIYALTENRAGAPVGRVIRLQPATHAHDHP